MLTGNSTIQLRNATVTDNTAAQDGGGVFIANKSDLFIRNTIIAANHDLTTSDSTDNPDCTIGIGGALTSEGFNLIGSDAGCAFAVQPGDQVGTNVNPIDPRLGPLADNGGPTRTHALLLTPVMSPAIDTANPAGCFSNDTNDGSLLTTDQRGSNRTFDGGPAGPSPARCDIGAFELGGCGDGFSDPAAEECDDGNTADGDGCSSTCLLESCGDGVIQIFEQCDDGNNVNGDGCDSNCHNEPVTEPEGGGICGNGIIESGEICDNGVANGNQPNRACRTDCSAQRCGDDIVDNALGEECDGNREDCNPTTCKIDACAVIAADAQNVVSRADLANFLDKYEVGLDGHSAIPGFEECVILFSAGGRVNVTDIKTRAENSAGCSLGQSERPGIPHLPFATLLLAPMSLLALKRISCSRSRREP
jgi:cysteine-rich repeat protein